MHQAVLTWGCTVPQVDLRFQCKQAYKAGFVTNRRQEQAVASAVVAAQRIPDTFVKLLDSS